LLNYSNIKDNSFKGKGNYFQHEKRFIWYDEMAIAKEETEILNGDKIFLLLKDKKLTGKYSVRDFLILLQDVRQVRIDEQWYQAEITKAIAKLLDKI